MKNLIPTFEDFMFQSEMQNLINESENIEEIPETDLTEAQKAKMAKGDRWIKVKGHKLLVDKDGNIKMGKTTKDGKKVKKVNEAREFRGDVMEVAVELFNQFDPRALRSNDGIKRCIKNLGYDLDEETVKKIIKAFRENRTRF